MGKPPKAHSGIELKISHSFEWHNSTVTKIVPSTLRNALVVVTKHNASTPNQSTTHKLVGRQGYHMPAAVWALESHWIVNLTPPIKRPA